MKETFVKRLRELIEREGISQRELAEDIGITEAALSRYMNGNRIPNGENLYNLATALRTTTDYLLGRDDEENFNKQISYEDMEGILARHAKNYTRAQRDELIRVILKIG